MKNLRKFLVVFTSALFMLSVLFTSCKSKKLVPPTPAPVEVAAPAPVPPPVPVAPADTDRDGIPDSSDKCPDEVGPASSNGCPEPVKINFTAQTILFEFNSAVLKTASYAVLDDISRVMKQFPDEQFNLNGHSSSEGSETRNMTLSRDRANAVKSYLVSAGVKEINLGVQGFGESMPINSNTTEVEKQLNRRVEIRKR